MTTETGAAAPTPDEAAPVASEASPAQSIAEALVRFQRDAPALPKDKINPHFSSRFTGLEAIVETIRPLLAEHGLAWTAQPGSDESGRPVLRYQLVHAPSGEQLDGVMPLMLSKQDAQALGSALTYARRYAITAVLNLVSDEDDDGNHAARAEAEAAPPPPPPLADEAALALHHEIENLYAAISAVDPSRIPPARYQAWLRGAEHSHEMLGRMRDHLKGVLDSMQGDAL